MVKKGLILFFYLLTLTSLILNVKVSAQEQVSIPDDVQEYCIKYGEEYEIAPSLLMAICWQETRCRANLSNGGCKGMCQINERFHKDEMELLGLDNLYDAEQNIQLCAYIIKELSAENDDLYYVLMCYNCGSTRGKNLYYEGKYTKYAKQVSRISAEIEESIVDMSSLEGRDIR